LCQLLSDLFPDSTQVRLVSLDQADDRTIRDYAGKNDFILVTQDSDFAELASVYGHPPKIIWLRCGNQSTPVIEGLIRKHREDIVAFGQSHIASCLEIFL